MISSYHRSQTLFHEPEIAMLRPSAFQLDEDDGKYCRYQKCITPSHSEREDSCKCYSALSTLDLDQIKIWFQNHWSHDRRRRVSTDPQVVNQFLAASKLLGQENKENSMHQEADERGSNLMHSLGLVLNQPDLQPSFSQRLSRVLNDADICFSSTALPLREGILRVMASMLLENASPMLLVQFLKEHYSFGNGRSEDEIGGILPWKLIYSLVEKDPPDELLRLRASLFGFRILPSEDNNWSSSQKLFLHGVLLLLLLDPHHYIQGEDESGMQFCGTLVFIFRVPISFQFPFWVICLDWLGIDFRKCAILLRESEHIEQTRTHVKPELTPGSPAMSTLLLASTKVKSHFIPQRILNSSQLTQP